MHLATTATPTGPPSWRLLSIARRIERVGAKQPGVLLGEGDLDPPERSGQLPLHWLQCFEDRLGRSMDHDLVQVAIDGIDGRTGAEIGRAGTLAAEAVLGQVRAHHPQGAPTRDLAGFLVRLGDGEEARHGQLTSFEGMPIRLEGLAIDLSFLGDLHVRRVRVHHNRVARFTGPTHRALRFERQASSLHTR